MLGATDERCGTIAMIKSEPHQSYIEQFLKADIGKGEQW